MIANGDPVAHEPAMDTIATLEVRRSDADVDMLVNAILDHLQPDGALVDLSSHDSSGRTILLRVRRVD